MVNFPSISMPSSISSGIKSIGSVVQQGINTLTKKPSTSQTAPVIKQTTPSVTIKSPAISSSIISSPITTAPAKLSNPFTSTQAPTNIKITNPFTTSSQSQNNYITSPATQSKPTVTISLPSATKTSSYTSYTSPQVSNKLSYQISTGEKIPVDTKYPSSIVNKPQVTVYSVSNPNLNRLTPSILTTPKIFVNSQQQQQETQRINNEAARMLQQKQTEKQNIFNQASMLSGVLESQQGRKAILLDIQQGKVPVRSQQDINTINVAKINTDIIGQREKQYQQRYNEFNTKLDTIQSQTAAIEAARQRSIQQVQQSDALRMSQQGYAKMMQSQNIKNKIFGNVGYGVTGGAIAARDNPVTKVLTKSLEGKI
jgi:hypothetical protein